MNQIIEKSLEKAMSYENYRTLVSDLLQQGKSTGDIQTENYLDYSKLGNARMKRLDKTFELSDEAKVKIKSSTKKYLWIVLTEGWCGDAGHALPIMNKIAEASEGIELNIILRDENNDLMDKFLTNGGRSIPKLIVLDAETHKVASAWGPRPSIATNMVNQQKKEKGTLDSAFKKELQVWYNKDKGQNILSDLLDLIE